MIPREADSGISILTANFRKVRSVQGDNKHRANS